VNVPDWLVWVSILLVSAALVFALFRSFVGPTIADRIAAIDNMTTVVASFMLIIALFFASSLYIDVAMVYAILSFIGVLVFARYMEGGP
jgi:multicomponent Na+:H+ antiporter subunit F